MGFISRGFQGRRQADAPAGRVPPGQYVTHDFPVLSAGPTPGVPLDQWRLRDRRQGRRAAQLDVAGASWRCRARTSRSTSTASRSGRSSTRPGRASRVDTLLEGCRRPRPSSSWPTSYGGYTTNLPLADMTGGKAWVALRIRRRAARAGARRPCPPAGAASLLLEEREVGARARAARRRRAGLLGGLRLQQLR